MQSPGTETAALVAFSLLDALMRRLVRQQTIMPEDAVDMLQATLRDLKGSTLAAAKPAIPVLEEMLQEYRKQTR